MTRVSLKITGAQGQGVNSVGEMCAKGLKRAGYCVFGYREYMSLIKGGHSSYQLDIAAEKIESSEQQVDILVCFNHHGLETNVEEVKTGGIILHQTPDWVWTEEQKKDLARRKITVLELPTDAIVAKLKAKPVVANVLIASVVWSLLGQSEKGLKGLVSEQFASKKDLLAVNMKCVEEGFAFRASHPKVKGVALPKADPKKWKDCLLVTGSQAMGLGLVHAGVRFYAGYPMTPSSPLLTYIAEIQNDTGMIIKQAEDEITAAQMVSGAMFAGTRAVTATSGGGFDLMTETVSLNGIAENPSVFVLAQRPGPGTGLPTWTAQGDLMLAVHGGHGEFARCVMAVSDSQDSFDLMNEAFTIAEVFQIPVIILTDKQLAEALWTQRPYDQKKAELVRGNLITKPKELAQLKSADRYNPKADYGISPRWLPGAKAATYAAQADEHAADGTVDETAANAKAQMEKRMTKYHALKAGTPEPVLRVMDGPAKKQGWENTSIDLLVVSWGSNAGVIQDVMAGDSLKSKRIAYLHYTFLWPLKTEELKALRKIAKKIVVVECNYTAQLGRLIAEGCDVVIDHELLKYDGRPFFKDELEAAFLHLLPKR